MRPAALAALLALCCVAWPAAAAAQDEPQRGITTTGTGTVTAQQDIAQFRLGVSVRRASPAGAQRAASARLTRVIAAIRRSGVANADVRTGSIRLFRQTERRGGRRRVVGYRAEQYIQATVRDLDRAGGVVDAAVRAGATDVEGPFFDVSNRRALYREALRLALRDAREKAQVLADEAGVTLGRAIIVVEQHFGGFDEAAANAGGGGGGDEAASTPIRPGLESIDAVLTVTFETS